MVSDFRFIIESDFRCESIPVVFIENYGDFTMEGGIFTHLDLVKIKEKYLKNKLESLKSAMSSNKFLF